MPGDGSISSRSEQYDETFAVGLEEGEEMYTFADGVVQELEKKGFGLIARPVIEKEHTSIFPGLNEGDYFDGRMPTILKKLSLDQVSMLYSLFNGWHAYIISELNIIQIEYSEATQKQELLWAMVRVRHKKHGRKVGVTISDQLASDLTRGDTRYIEANAKLLQVKALKSSVEKLIKVVETNLKLISREITVRGVQAQTEQRGANFSSRVRSARYANQSVEQGDKDEDRGSEKVSAKNRTVVRKPARKKRPSKSKAIGRVKLR